MFGEQNFSTSQPGNPGSGSSFQSEQLPQILWRQRWTIAGSVGAVLFLAGIYLLLAPAKYTAVAKLEVKGTAPVLMNENLETPSYDPQANERLMNTEAALIRSTPVLAHAIGMPGAEDMAIFAGAQNRKIPYLKKHLKVDVVKNAQLLTVSLAAKDPDEAVRVVDAVVDAYVAYRAGRKRSNTGDVLEILRAEKEKTDAELRDVTSKVLQFRREYNTLSFESDKNNLTLQKLTSLSNALTEASLETVNARAKYEEAASRLPPQSLDQLDTLGTNPLSVSGEDALQAEKFALRQRLAELRLKYLPNHPNIQTLEARIRLLDLSTVAALKQRWLAAKAREQSLQASFDQQQQIAMEQNVKAAEYARLVAEEKRLADMSDNLSMRIKTVAVAENAGAMNLEPIETAEIDEELTTPKKAHTAAIALGLGLMLGVGLALLRELSDPRVRTPDEAKGSLGLPVVGLLPRLDPAQSPETRAWTVHLEPASEAAEAIRSLGTSLQANPGHNRTILVTSPAARDGKSMVAANLAMALAKAGRSVLLVDAHFNHPVQQMLFGVSDEIGFSNVLHAGEVVDRSIRRTAVERLDVMPAGPVPRSASELLNSPILGEILEELSRRYDHVVIDTAPVSRGADSRILAASCDQTLLVVRAGKTNRKLSEAARDGLWGVAAQVFGVVVNDVAGGAGEFVPQIEVARDLDSNSTRITQTTETTKPTGESRQKVG